VRALSESVRYSLVRVRGSRQRMDVDAERLGMVHGSLEEHQFMRMSSRSKHAGSQGGARLSFA
jgi:division protein CdvB (Snf7/Vps24/ESCRT-III family)